MTVRGNIKDDRRQVSFYPRIELIDELDRLAESQEGKTSRAYIIEKIILEAFKEAKKKGEWDE